MRSILPVRFEQMPKDWSKRVVELKEQVRITEKKAELQQLIAKKESKKEGKKKVAPKKQATKPKAVAHKPSKKKSIAPPPPQFILMLPNGATIPMSSGKKLALPAPIVTEP